jgi:hypothetical protein
MWSDPKSGAMREQLMQGVYVHRRHTLTFQRQLQGIKLMEILDAQALPCLHYHSMSVALELPDIKAGCGWSIILLVTATSN